MPKPKNSRSKKEAGNPYSILLDRIVMGEYAPGASLSEQEIADELGTSRTPVREALLRLRIEGLVRIVPRGGIFVAEATLRLVREVTSLRLVLEEYLANLVVERRTDAWVKKFDVWLVDAKSHWESWSHRMWMQKDGEFHSLLEEAAGDEVLADHLRLLRRQAVLFWGQTTDGKASLRSIIEDFESVFCAIQRGEVQACVEILHRHVLAHVDRIQNYMKPEARRMGFSKVLA